MITYLGADHRGFKLKEKVVAWLGKEGVRFKDLGAHQFDKKDDYTIFAERVASLVARDKSAKGILLCGSGVGVDVVANKFDGVRASVGKSPKQVKAGRRDDDMNVLVLAADFTSEAQARKMVKVFLRTKFDGAVRHKRRLAEIKKIEANN